MQWRNLNFLPLDEVGSHSDHSPHSAQVTVAPAEKKKKEEIYNFLPNEPEGELPNHSVKVMGHSILDICVSKVCPSELNFPKSHLDW